MPSGSNGELKYGGIPFAVAGDADFTEIFSQFTNTGIATSGKTSLSQQKRVPTVDGIVLILRPGDKKLLAERADAGKKLRMSYRNRNGDKYSGMGWLNIESNTTMENRCTVQAIPEGKWTEQLNNA